MRRAAWLLAAAILSGCAHAGSGPAARAVAFDFFVLFDANSVVPEAEAVFPGRGAEFTKAWRTKQFEYGFLRSITNRYEDFFRVTADALDYTAELLHLRPGVAGRKRLLDAYLHLKPWPDTEEGLRKLRAAGVKIITIANFSPEMLKANADNAGLTPFFDDLLSTEANRSYKPDAEAYELGRRRLGLAKDRIVFAAYGGWDAHGAATFGFPTVWVNRSGLPAERLGSVPNLVCRDMECLTDFVLRDAPAEGPRQRVSRIDRP